MGTIWNISFQKLKFETFNVNLKNSATQYHQGSNFQMFNNYAVLHFDVILFYIDLQKKIEFLALLQYQKTYTHLIILQMHLFHYQHLQLHHH